MSAAPEKLWEVLADGWLYPLWVVGATRMREVDEEWPAVGAELHHSVGVWPLVVDDTTQVVDVEPGRMLRLRARSWPGGEAEVVMTLDPHPKGTLVTMWEDVVKGPAVVVPRPARVPAIKWRNTEALRRLAYLAERR